MGKKITMDIEAKQSKSHLVSCQVIQDVRRGQGSWGMGEEYSITSFKTCGVKFSQVLSRFLEWFGQRENDLVKVITDIWLFKSCWKTGKVIQAKDPEWACWDRTLGLGIWSWPYLQ